MRYTNRRILYFTYTLLYYMEAEMETDLNFRPVT